MGTGHMAGPFFEGHQSAHGPHMTRRDTGPGIVLPDLIRQKVQSIVVGPGNDHGIFNGGKRPQKLGIHGFGIQNPLHMPGNSDNPVCFGQGCNAPRSPGQLGRHELSVHRADLNPQKLFLT